MTMGRERRRKHDDAHRPLQGEGKRAPRSVDAVLWTKCPDCRSYYPIGQAHLCHGSVRGPVGENVQSGEGPGNR